MTLFTRANGHHRRPSISGALVFGALFCTFMTLSTFAARGVAQTVEATPELAQSSGKSPNTGPPAAARNISSSPAWKDLTPTQRSSLQPLAESWNTLGDAQKRKWMALAAGYPTLGPAEQAKLHSRMTEWASLSQRQRDQARLNFAESKRLTPSQKTATWEAYQALSPEEKKKLAISASPKPTGAAAATKPVLPKKMATVPLTKEAPKQMPKISASNHAVNPNTLLPYPQPPNAPGSAQKK